MAAHLERARGLAKRFDAKAFMHVGLADVNEYGEHEDVVKLALRLLGVTPKERRDIELALNGQPRLLVDEAVQRYLILNGREQ